jgi:hypothetical protein
MEIKYPPTKRAEGAARYYAAGDQVYMQPVDDEGELIPDDYTHIDHGKTPERALEIADTWQKKENKIVQNKKQRK